MATVKGQYSKGINGGYDENERLLFGLVRPGIPWVDGDANQSQFANFTWIRRALDTVIGNASPNDGFRCVGDGAANDFSVEGGDGTLTGAGRMWISGLHCFLTADIRWSNTASTTDEASIYPEISFITGLGNEVLEDSAADYVVNSLAGRVLTPDVTQPVTTVNILSNTARTITTDGDLTLAGIIPGARYRVEMSTPAGGGRNDGVYLNVALDEVDGTELPSITHNLGTQLTAQFFAQVRAHLEVHQGDAVGLPGSLSTNYVDADGFEHVRIKIAEITRFDGQGTIDAPDIADLRTTSANFSTFLKKTGDNMTGDLVMQLSDILLDPGQTVDGRDVSVDGAKLDTIDWTPTGVAGQLALVSKPVQGVNLTGVTTSVTPVGFALRPKEPGATDLIRGLYTTAPENNVIIKRVSDDDEFLAGTDDAQKVFGRLTESHPFPNLTGTWTFTNATFNVTGVGGAANTELAAGDLVRGPDGLFYTVTVVNNDDDFDILEPFAGATGPTVSPDARRWLLSFFVNDEGTETSVGPGAGPNFETPADIRWYYEEVFGADDRPVRDSTFSVTSDQVAAEVPDATTTVKGKVALAVDFDPAATVVPAGSDSRLLGTGAHKSTDALVPTDRGPISMVEGSGIGVTHSFVGGEHVFTFSSTGGPGLSLDTVTTPQNNEGSGEANPSAATTAAPSDHKHPALRTELKELVWANESGAKVTSAWSFTPVVGICLAISQDLAVDETFTLSVGYIVAGAQGSIAHSMRVEALDDSMGMSMDTGAVGGFHDLANDEQLFNTGTHAINGGSYRLVSSAISGTTGLTVTPSGTVSTKMLILAFG
jgi:hypothetical protein